MEYDVGLTKNYCLTVSMLKISLTFTFSWTHSLDIADFRVSSTKWPCSFLTMPTQNHWNTFSFPEFAPACKISVHFIQSFLKYSQFQSPVTRLATPIFDNVHLKNFWSNFNLCELVSTCKESGYFTDLFWRYIWLKNPAIWLPENILAHISGTKISPNMGFV